MKRVFLEIIVGVAFVLAGTYIAYWFFSGDTLFWSAQQFWSAGLILCWCIVAGGYFHQGWVIHKAKSATHVSFILPIAVFIVQCILFVKGIYYHDWSLIVGALMVNAGVVFNLYQIFEFRIPKK